MTHLTTFGIIVLIIISILYAKRVDSNPNHPYNQTLQRKATSKEEDKPLSFGYKCMWIAVKTSQQQRVAEIIGLKNLQQCNWSKGIKNAYDKSVFITPPIDKWTLAVGWGLPSGDSNESMEEVKKLLNKLSTEFEEAQFFCTHRVVEYHCWIKSTHGNINRVYSYLGERGENLEISGEPTQIEKKYKLVNTFSEKIKFDDNKEQENLTYPDEELVMKIAGNWSVNPSLLENRSDIKGLGLLGQRK